LIQKVKSLSKLSKSREKQLEEKDQKLSDLKIDFSENLQALEEYKAELEKVGDVDRVKKRLENEKRARCQLVKEKVGIIVICRQCLRMSITLK
jgi:hypothetical protein